MPDLDRLFQAFRDDADLVPTADISAVRALGRRRRVRHTTAAVVVGILVAAVLAGPALLPRATRPPADRTSEAVAFMPLRTVGDEEATFGTEMTGQLKSVATAIANGRGYAVWQHDDGVPTVAALDIGSGRSLWGPVTLDPATAWAIYALPQAVAVITDPPDGDDMAVTVTVLDPTTGERRWQRTLRALDGVPYESAVVVVDHATGLTEAIDWASGQTLWKATDPSGSVLTVLGMRVSDDMSLAESHSAAGSYVGLPYSDHRLVEVGGDRVARVYDIRTGQLLGSRTALGNEALAYNGTVFAVRDSTATVPNQVLAYQAVGTDTPRIVYQSPHGTSRLRSLTPCGARRICLVEGYGTNNGADAEVVAVDIDAQASAWRTQSGDLDALTPMGEHVLGRTDDGLIGIYGADHSTVLSPRGSADVADRVDAGSILLLRRATDEASQTAGDTHIVGVVAATGEQVALGRVRIWPTSCSWDSRFLLCATGTGLQVWRFAAD